MSKEFEDGMTMPAKVAMQTDIRKGQLALNVLLNP